MKNLLDNLDAWWVDLDESKYIVVFLAVIVMVAVPWVVRQIKEYNKIIKE